MWTAIAPDLANTKEFSQNAFLMMQVTGLSTFASPFQVPPLIVAMVLTGENLQSLLGVLLAFFMITNVVLLPLDYLWWRFLGTI